MDVHDLHVGLYPVRISGHVAIGQVRLTTFGLTRLIRYLFGRLGEMRFGVAGSLRCHFFGADDCGMFADFHFGHTASISRRMVSDLSKLWALEDPRDAFSGSARTKYPQRRRWVFSEIRYARLAVVVSGTKTQTPRRTLPRSFSSTRLIFFSKVSLQLKKTNS